MEKKFIYEAPDVEMIELGLENKIMVGSEGKWDNSIKSGSTWADTDNIDYGLE